jgi:hypothetical protein
MKYRIISVDFNIGYWFDILHCQILKKTWEYSWTVYHLFIDLESSDRLLWNFRRSQVFIFRVNVMNDLASLVYIFYSVKLMPCPVGILCSRRSESNCVVTHPSLPCHHVASPNGPVVKYFIILVLITQLDFSTFVCHASFKSYMVVNVQFPQWVEICWLEEWLLGYQEGN